MKKIMILGALVAPLALALCTTPAYAQSQNCAERDVVAERLTSGYGEQQQSMGLSQGTAVETWANTDTGSWSILVTRPDGVSCLVASGQNFVITGDAPEGDPV